MATAKERAVTAELMADPDYRAAWEAIRQAVRDVDYEDIEGSADAVADATKMLFRLLDRRPDLAGLVEAAESEDH